MSNTLSRNVMKAVKVLISFVVLLIIWQLYVTLSGINTALFPTPKLVIKAFGELFMKGLPGSTSKLTMTNHIAVSLIRFFIGYCSSVVLAVLLGLLFGYFPKAFAFVNPVIQLIRPVAPVAFMPFIVLWFGIGDVPAIVIIFIAGFFPVLLSTVAAVGSVEPVYLKVASNYGMSRLATVFQVIFPAIFPQIANSLHLALGTSWIFLVSGEMVGAQSGLGFLIMDTKNCIRMDSLMATILTIGLIGFLLDSCMKKLERLVLRRYGR